MKKISDKIKRLINASQRKLALQKRKLKTIVISLLDNSSKKNMPILLRIPKIGTKKANVAMIGEDTYCTTCRLKRAQVFAISMKDLKY